LKTTEKLAYPPDLEVYMQKYSKQGIRLGIPAPEFLKAGMTGRQFPLVLP
jgi:hypothetical protein